MTLKLTSLSLAAGLLAIGSITTHAATATWTNSVDTLWTTAGNWDPGVPGVGDDILFPNVTGQTVDLNVGTYSIGTLTFNAPDAYSVANGQLTLGGDVTQSGAGTVALNSITDLGGATRVFNGVGSGVVTFNGAVTGAGFRASLNGGNYVIANTTNTIDRWEITNGASAVLLGSLGAPNYPASSIFGGDGVGGGFFINLNGGTLNNQFTDTVTAPGGATPATTTGSAGWADRAIVFGPNGGTLVYDTIPPTAGPTVWFSQGGTSTLVVGQPQPYSGDWAANANNFRSPFEVDYGVSLGIFQNTSYTYAGAPATYKWRQGSGDFQLILTNGASAFLEWNALTNGNFIVRGHPGGDSSVIETNATGWTRNVGRLAIRGPHRAGVQYSDASGNYPVGAISRSFCIPQYNGNGMVFHDAVQVWSRDGGERLACDMSFESGSTVDICSGRRTQGLDLGHPGNGTILGPTNQITIKSGGKLNLNLQMRSQYGDGATGPRGYSAGLRVFAKIGIKDGGQLKMYRSQNNCIGLNEVAAGDTGGNAGRAATKCIELFRPITGEGSTASDARVVVDLPFSDSSVGNKDSWGGFGKDGVNFNGLPNPAMGTYPGADLIVNGTGDYGLRLVGQSGYVSNLLANGRSSRVSGTGGTLTVAATDSAPMWIPGGPASTPVYLGLDRESGSTPNYILRPGVGLGGFAGLILKGGTAIVEDSSNVTMKTMRLASSATIRLGTGSGGSVLNFDNSSAVAWNAGTLTITSWNGNPSGGGSDQIKFGTDATGLTAAQLAQVRWIAPNGGANVAGAQILSTGEIVPAPATTIANQTIIGGQIVLQVVPGLPTLTSVVQCATNLTPPVVWQNILTNTGTFNFTNSANLAESYYRVLVP